ncbi:MAG: prephenate dehydrogenase [Ruminococcaceae bacterium]|nr:prephenate dehydrogenase [Oscillospiraceae bacterium]
MIDRSTKFLIVGLGLMGGGYAKALSKKGYNVSALTLEQKDIDYALERGMIVSGATFPDEKLISSANIIVFAVYPKIFIKWINENQHMIRPGTLITDVTGVKTCIVDEIQSILRKDVEFIAAHPMAGREQSGVEFSDDKIFQGANYIVTPTPLNTPHAIETCKQLGEILGFGKISELTPEKHDEMIAFLSQLTHVIAVTLMTCNTREGLEKYTGDSFRDLTRIAKINDLMWSELFMLNKDALLEQIDRFSAELEKMRRYLAENDRESMRQMMRTSTERRKLFDKKI